MTGPEHYRQAEQLLADSRVRPGHDAERVNRLPPGFGADFLVAQAQVHASLALAAATALCQADQHGRPDPEEWTAWVRTAGAWQDTTPPPQRPTAGGRTRPARARRALGPGERR